MTIASQPRRSACAAIFRAMRPLSTSFVLVVRGQDINGCAFAHLRERGRLLERAHGGAGSVDGDEKLFHVVRVRAAERPVLTCIKGPLAGPR
jgi:hypothetical protein